MIRLNCPKCNSEISSTDTKCINCGLDMKSIRFELKKKALMEQGTISKEGKKKNTIIVIIELSIILIIAGIYTKVFLPEILKESDNRQTSIKAANCENQGGTWDYKLNSCDYDNGLN